MQRVKIVATLGPSSSSREIVAQMIDEGLDVVRLNFSHGTHRDHRRLFEVVREEAARKGEMVAVLADLCGPKIRVGEIEGGGVELEEGARITVTTGAVVGDASRVSTSYAALVDDVGAGDRILLDDGLIELEVEGVSGADVGCRVVQGGRLGSRKGMNIPGTPLSTPALTEKDIEDLRFARELGVDYFALSFVRRADDIEQAKELAGPVPVIAKIEKPEALDALDEILDVADGVMVARGDLGVEAGAERVPLIQKRLIREASARGMPVIVATQMLDSMIHHPRPTRAEVSDVANAVLDGTDAVMLSGETASGAYPVAAVREMATILEEVEGSDIFRLLPAPERVAEDSFSNAIARASVTAAADLGLTALVTYTETGHSAELVSACRPMAAIVAFSRHPDVLRRLALRWGVVPVQASWTEGVEGVVEQAERILVEKGLATSGNEIGITFGTEELTDHRRTDMLKLWRVR